MDWLDLLAVQETLKSLLQHHSSKESVLQHSAFFMVQLSHPYMTPGKAIAPRSYGEIFLTIREAKVRYFCPRTEMLRQSTGRRWARSLQSSPPSTFPFSSTSPGVEGSCPTPTLQPSLHPKSSPHLHGFHR